jgi:hypothetical protein
MKNTATPVRLARLKSSRVEGMTLPVSFVASACELGPKVKLSALIAS